MEVYTCLTKYNIPEASQLEFTAFTICELEEMSLVDLQEIVGKGTGFKIFKLLEKEKKARIAYGNAGLKRKDSQVTGIPKYSVGERVTANWKGENDWYDGEITAVTGNTYTVAYTDGDVEKDVSEIFIELDESTIQSSKKESTILPSKQKKKDDKKTKTEIQRK